MENLSGNILEDRLGPLPEKKALKHYRKIPAPYLHFAIPKFQEESADREGPRAATFLSLSLRFDAVEEAVAQAESGAYRAVRDYAGERLLRERGQVAGIAAEKLREVEKAVLDGEEARREEWAGELGIALKEPADAIQTLRQELKAQEVRRFFLELPNTEARLQALDDIQEAGDEFSLASLLSAPGFMRKGLLGHTGAARLQQVQAGLAEARNPGLAADLEELDRALGLMRQDLQAARVRVYTLTGVNPGLERSKLSSEERVSLGSALVGALPIQG